MDQLNGYRKKIGISPLEYSSTDSGWTADKLFIFEFQKMEKEHDPSFSRKKKNYRHKKDIFKAFCYSSGDKLSSLDISVARDLAQKARDTRVEVQTKFRKARTEMNEGLKSINRGDLGIQKFRSTFDGVHSFRKKNKIDAFGANSAMLETIRI